MCLAARIFCGFLFKMTNSKVFWVFITIIMLLSAIGWYMGVQYLHK